MHTHTHSLSHSTAGYGWGGVLMGVGAAVVGGVAISYLRSKADDEK